MLNRVILHGRLGADVEVKQMGSTSVAEFRLAVERSFKREGQPECDWFRCKAFGKTAESIAKFFGKGDPILVEGQIQNREWTDNEGTVHRITEIIVEHFDFVGGGKRESSTATATETVTPQEIAGEKFEVVEVIDDELPF